MFFKWAPPQPDFQDYIGLSIGGNEAAAHRKEAHTLKARYRRMSGIALGLVACGLFLQLHQFLAIRLRTP